MKACYDLWVSPATYDFGTFLATIEIERIRRGDEEIELVFAPGAENGFRKAKLPPFGAEREEMFQNVVLPMTKLLPSIKSVERRTERTCLDGYFGFERKMMGLPRHMKVLKDPNGRCLKIAGEKEDLVTFTLRECEYYPERNNNLEIWLEAAGKLDCEVVFVRDTAKADEKLPFPTDPEASRDLLKRAELYGRAKVNCFTPNGPAIIAQLGNLPMITFWKTGDNHGATSKEYLHGCGMTDQWPGPAHQRFVWEEGDIVHEVSNYL